MDSTEGSSIIDEVIKFFKLLTKLIGSCEQQFHCHKSFSHIRIRNGKVEIFLNFVTCDMGVVAPPRKRFPKFDKCFLKNDTFSLLIGQMKFKRAIKNHFSE